MENFNHEPNPNHEHNDELSVDSETARQLGRSGLVSWIRSGQPEASSMTDEYESTESTEHRSLNISEFISRQVSNGTLSSPEGQEFLQIDPFDLTSRNQVFEVIHRLSVATLESDLSIPESSQRVHDLHMVEMRMIGHILGQNDLLARGGSDSEVGAESKEGEAERSRSAAADEMITSSFGDKAPEIKKLIAQKDQETLKALIQSRKIFLLARADGSSDLDGFHLYMEKLRGLKKLENAIRPRGVNAAQSDVSQESTPVYGESENTSHDLKPTPSEDINTYLERQVEEGVLKAADVEKLLQIHPGDESARIQVVNIIATLKGEALSAAAENPTDGNLADNLNIVRGLKRVQYRMTAYVLSNVRAGMNSRVHP